MARSIEITPKPFQTIVTHNGKPLEVTLSTYGDFRTDYRSQEVVERSLTALRARLEGMDEEAKVKRERAKALKAAAANPVPATTEGGSTIYVRGIDARSGRILITRADGTTSQTYPASVLRVLTEAEAAELRDAKQALSDAQVRQREADKAGGSSYEISQRDLDLEADYDASVDGFTVSHDGTTFGPSTLQSLREQVVARIADTEYPYRLHCGDGQAVRIDQDGVDRAALDGSNYFKTEADAREYQAARHASKEARQRVADLLKRFAFDFSTLQ